MQPVGEPSVEEILASIKRVIARDAHAPFPRPGNAARDDAADHAAADDAVEPADADEAEEMLELSDQAPAADDAAATYDTPAPYDTGAPDHPDAARDTLTGAATQAAMRGSLADLALIARLAAPAADTARPAAALEDTVRDLLRPLLAEWLDTHLPAIVERLVREEIVRIAGARG